MVLLGTCLSRSLYVSCACLRQSTQLLTCTFVRGSAQLSIAGMARADGQYWQGSNPTLNPRLPQVVLDEADTMFDRGFGPEVRAVLGPLKSKASPARVVLVCATLTPVRTLEALLVPLGPCVRCCRERATYAAMWL